MNIRAASPADRPAIIDLLKRSLGESTVPKSESLWKWKHEENPFGESYVLLAEEGSELIGIRAFMQWDWQWKGQTFKAIRAVDTATDPKHQGKGIFKKLTLKQAEACKQQGVHFVFNTPNTQSKPGYLKMGWEEQGKMPLKFKLMQPLSMGYSLVFKKRKISSYKEDLTPGIEWNESIYTISDQAITTDESLATVISGDYVRWRYGNNPLANYNYITDQKSFLVIVRIKNHSFGKELRIADFILLDKVLPTANVGKHIKTLIKQYCKDHNIQFVTLSGQQFYKYQSYFNWMGVLPVKRLGPTVTLKDLNMNNQFTELLDISNWSYSLGDMELF